MPSLPDLAPELIEKISELADDHILTTKARDEQSWDPDLLRDKPKVRAPALRCVSRYIERATRRLFINTFFNSWHIMAAGDQNIQKICTIVKTSDVLAKGLKELNLHVDDDGSYSKLHGEMRFLDVSMTMVLEQSCLLHTSKTRARSPRH